MCVMKTLTRMAVFTALIGGVSLANARADGNSVYVAGKGKYCKETAVVPGNHIRTDSCDEAESAHDPTRCVRSSICLGRLSAICSSRGAGLKSRISFSDISSI